VGGLVASCWAGVAEARGAVAVTAPARTLICPGRNIQSCEGRDARPEIAWFAGGLRDANPLVSGRPSQARGNYGKAWARGGCAGRGAAGVPAPRGGPRDPHPSAPTTPLAVGNRAFPRRQRWTLPADEPRRGASLWAGPRRGSGLGSGMGGGDGAASRLSSAQLVAKPSPASAPTQQTWQRSSPHRLCFARTFGLFYHPGLGRGECLQPTHAPCAPSWPPLPARGDASKPGWVPFAAGHGVPAAGGPEIPLWRQPGGTAQL